MAPTMPNESQKIPKQRQQKNKHPTKSKKQLAKEIAEVTDEDRKPGVVYIGHIPHGFYERQLNDYFSQFGDVMQIKLSRSKKTGNSKGYAFVKFRYAAVARTVAETCHNYLFFNKLLKCEFKHIDDIHPETFFRYRMAPNERSKRLHNRPLSEKKTDAAYKQIVGKQKSKMKKLKAMGLDIDLEDIVEIKPKEENEQTEVSQPSTPKAAKSSPKLATPNAATPKSAQKTKPNTPKEATPKVATPKLATLKAATPKIATPISTTPKVTTPKSTETKKANTPKEATPKAATPKLATPKSSETKKANTPKSTTPAKKATTPSLKRKAETEDAESPKENTVKRVKMNQTPSPKKDTPPTRRVTRSAKKNK